MSTLAPPQPKPKAKARAKGSALQKALAESGRPLPEAVRIDLEIKFSADLRDVRVHTGPLADEVAREMGAEALTFGKHIFFRAGTWQPETPSGRDLLAHEAAHTLQQDAATTAPVETPVSEPDDTTERSAVEATETDTAPAPKAEAVAARRVAGIAPREKRTIDPARTVEDLARTLILRVRSDTQDASGRIRNQLIRMDDDLRRDVLRWMEAHMESHEWRDFVDVLAQDVPAGLDGTEDAQAAAKAGLPEETPAAPASMEAPAGKAEGPEKEDAEAAEPKTPAGKVSDQAGEGEEPADGAPTEAAVAQPALEGGAPDETGEAGQTAAGGGGPAPAAAQAGAAAAPAAPASSAAAPPAMEQPAVAEPAEDADEGARERERPAGGRAGAAARTADPAVESGEAEAEPQAGAAAGQAATSSEPEEMAAAGSEAGGGSAAGSDVSPDASTATPEASESGAGDEPKAEASGEGSAPGDTDTSAAAEGEAAGSAAPPEAAVQDAGPATAEPAAPELAQAVAPEASEPEAPGGEPAATEATRALENPTGTGEAAGVEAAAVQEPQEQTTSPTIEQPAEAAAAGDVAGAEPAVPAGETVPAEGTTEVAAPEGPAETAAPSGDPAAVPPGLLGEFAGEPQENEAAAPSGGGGGGAAVPDPPPEPDAAESIPAGDPVGAMESVGTMKVAAAAQAMGSATATVAAQSASQQQELASAPPTIDRPTGSPQGADGYAPGQVPAPPAMDPLKKTDVVAAGAPVPLPPVPGAPEPGAPVTQGISRPQVTGNAEGKITESDARRVQNAVDDVPVTDEFLNTTVDEPTDVPLEGDADPAHVQQQQSALMESAATNVAQGALDVAKPMGEDHLYPAVTPGIIRPDVSVAPAGGTTAGPEGAATGPIDIGVATVAEEEHGDEVRQSATGAAGRLTTEQGKQTEQQETANKNAQKNVNDAITANAKEQAAERTSARKEVQDQRTQWTEGQKDAVDTATKDSNTAVQGAQKDIDKKKTDAQTKADGHVAEGNRKITAKRLESERDAREKKEKAKRDSEDDGGILGWLASSITSFFNDLMNAVHAVFDLARKAVKAVIDEAQKLVHEVIDAARSAIVGLIKAAGDALLAISDTLLAAFPELRDKFHKAIQSAVDGAVKKVNELADALEKGIRDLLNGLMNAINAIISAFEAIYTGIIKAVADLVKGVIDKVRSVIAALAAFASLVKDIAPAPGQWLSNLGSSIMDGIQNHLWTALKLAFRNWFNDTIEGIIGMGRMVLDVLRKGGLSLKKIAGFVWSAIISAIPGIVVQVLIEKLIAMIIPAAGAVMLIVQGLIAAWGAVQRIIAAFQMFLVFLKAVKNGNAGPQFATALAAAAIALIQFLAGFIMSRMGGAASGVTGKLKAIAQKIMAFFKKVGKAIGKGLKVVGRVIVKGAKAVGRLVVKGAKAVGRVVVRGAKAVARVAKRAAKAVVRVLKKTKVGRAILRAGRKVIGKVRGGYKKLKGWVKKKHDQFKEWRKKRKEKKKAAHDERFKRALEVIKPGLSKLFAKGVSSTRLRLQLAFWKWRYRLSVLARRGGTIHAAASPGVDIFSDVVRLEPRKIGEVLEEILIEAEEQFYRKRYADPQGAHSKRLQKALEQYRAGEVVEMSGGRAEKVYLMRVIAETGLSPDKPYEGFDPKLKGLLAKLKEEREFQYAYRGAKKPLSLTDEPGTSVYHGAILNTDTGGVTLRSGSREARGSSTFYNPRVSTYVKEENRLALSARRADLRELTEVTEPARLMGHFGSSEVSLALGKEGLISDNELRTGKYNPAAGKLTATVADRDFRGMMPEDGPKTKLTRKERKELEEKQKQQDEWLKAKNARDEKKRAKLEADALAEQNGKKPRKGAKPQTPEQARRQEEREAKRHAARSKDQERRLRDDDPHGPDNPERKPRHMRWNATAEIFRTLERVNPDVLVAGESQQALGRIQSAFKAWVVAHFVAEPPHIAHGEEVELVDPVDALRKELISTLAHFMEIQNRI